MITDITSQNDLGKFLINLSKKLKIGDLFHGQINFTRHPVSKTEFIGTLVHAGFDLVTEKDQNGRLHFTLKKLTRPGRVDEINRAKTLIFKQTRIGLAGKPITIWKLRTMYPMAHSAHEYMIKKHPSGPYGKIANDFRITPMGKLFRRYWLDELFQIINILKGEMKLVGLRPLTKSFFKVLPPALQRERIKHLPALMAAIYADQPKNLEERFKSELRYLEAHAKHPFLTDFTYFFKILWAIIFRGQRGY